MKRFQNLGVIKNNANYDPAQLDKFLNVIASFRDGIVWEKRELVDLFNELIPDFNHKETGKYLDEKM